MEQNEHSKYEDPKKRAEIGKMSGLIGIACNFLLAGSKIAVGNFAGSTSIVADGLNNMSDAASSAVTLIGFKLAEKPADREHPYGHARFEYLASLVVSAMILVIGLELAQKSVEKIKNPIPVEFSCVTLAVLVFSILMKSGMAVFNSRMGKKIQSTTLIATAADSRNDVVTTTAVLLATLAEHFFGWKADGPMGILVSLFVLYSGVTLAKETISPLLGEGADAKIRTELMNYVKEHPLVLGCHDLMVHDYGPGKCYASIHVEMDKDVDPMKCHDVIDHIERECLEKFGTNLVIHYDPVSTNDLELEEMREFVEQVLVKRDERLLVHDFRMREKEGKTELMFDLVLPDTMQEEKENIRKMLEESLESAGKQNITLNITFDPEPEM
ncbi:MAG: cation diffusion facilitator family transporter [Lachnospiraceae bacterium]